MKITRAHHAGQRTGAIASVELQSRVHETLEKVGLQQVLNDLRIVIDPDWREIDVL